MPPGAERVAALQRWLDCWPDRRTEVLAVRNSDIRALCAEIMPNGKPRGPAATARLLGMSLSTVKAAKGPA